MTVLEPADGGAHPAVAGMAEVVASGNSGASIRNPAAAASVQAATTVTHVTLKVSLSPQRPRTVISFENRIYSAAGAGTRPSLTVFPHMEGARVRAMALHHHAPRRCACPALCLHAFVPSSCIACLHAQAGRACLQLQHVHSLHAA